MASDKKVYGLENPILHQSIISLWHCMSKKKKPKTIAAQSEIGNLAGLQLKLQFVSNQGNEFGSKEASFTADFLAG